jgi:hypothetical protein
MSPEQVVGATRSLANADTSRLGALLWFLIHADSAMSSLRVMFTLPLISALTFMTIRRIVIFRFPRHGYSGGQRAKLLTSVQRSLNSCEIRCGTLNENSKSARPGRRG